MDKIFENQENMSQNSNMFHVRFSMLLSSVVQMKNSLIKCLEHEAKEQNPDLKVWTQIPVIDGGINPEMAHGCGFNNYEDDLTVYTPKDFHNEQSEVSFNGVSRENINLLYLFDDEVYLDFLIKTLRGKGVKIVDFPTIHDQATVIPFLLVNDHSIVIVRNPKKDILPLLKMIMRKGTIFFK